MGVFVGEETLVGARVGEKVKIEAEWKNWLSFLTADLR